MQDPHCIAKAFVEHYYVNMASNKEVLANLYVDQSMMSFEDQQCVGKESVMSKFRDLKFKKIEHTITSIDCQPIIGLDNNKALVVVVMGKLKTDDDHPHSFSQTFILREVPNVGYVIANEVFRMILHNV